MNEITRYHDDEDGFSGPPTGGQVIRGQIIRWNESNKWTDRDGIRPPEILLAIALFEAVQRWQGKKPVETITAKPLPNVDKLNESVPKNEWEPDLDGITSRPPWKHQVGVYLIDPGSGGTFTFVNSTTGAHVACDLLRERVITMRALRGARVVPVVKLTERPMKTFFGMKKRPEFEIVAWKQLGGGSGSSFPAPQSPQLPGPGYCSDAESGRDKNGTDSQS